MTADKSESRFQISAGLVMPRPGDAICDLQPRPRRHHSGAALHC